MIRAALGALGVLLAGVAVFFVWGPDLLCINDGKPQAPADLVVVLAGPAIEDGRRVTAAVGLVRGESARIMLLPVRHRALDWPWFVRHYKIAEPIGDDQVIVGGTDAAAEAGSQEVGGTFTEAVKTVELMRRHRYRSAVIVSSCYHMRRARLAFERASGTEKGLAFHFFPVDDGPTDGAELWWRKEGAIWRLADEYLKLLGGYIFYR